MTAASHPNPIHAILLAFPIGLFTAAAVTDITYLNTAQIQWSNFSSWLLAGGLFFGGLVLLWAIIDLARWRTASGRNRRTLYVLLLAVMWVTGFIDALLHSRDAWYSVTATGLVLSIVTALLALAAGWVFHADPYAGKERI